MGGWDGNGCVKCLSPKSSVKLSSPTWESGDASHIDRDVSIFIDACQVAGLGWCGGEGGEHDANMAGFPCPTLLDIK